jgi:hypothetical protein
MKTKLSSVPSRSVAEAMSCFVNERVAEAQAILALASTCDADAVAPGAVTTAHAAALDILSDVVSAITFEYGTLLDRSVIARVSGRIVKAQALISLIAHSNHDDDGDSFELASDVANRFLEQAMETLEQEAA